MNSDKTRTNMLVGQIKVISSILILISIGYLFYTGFEERFPMSLKSHANLVTQYQSDNHIPEDTHVKSSVTTYIETESLPVQDETSMPKPHVILILADDMGYTALGTDKNELVFAAPVLNELAANGISLSNYYAQEVCTPARASLLTGRHPMTLGMQYFMVQSAIPWGLSLDETTMAEAFASNGYRTHMLGKWHLGHYSARYLPTARGFETFTGMLNGESNYWSKRNLDHEEYRDFLVANQQCYSPYLEEDLHEYSTHIYRDKAIDIIQTHDETEPLFLYLSFQAVHDPFGDIYDTHDNGVESNYLAPSVHSKIISTIKGTKRQQYTMALNIMDQAIGDIMQALKDKEMYQNTFVIFSSDNGGCYGGGGMNGPLRGTKGSLFEGGVKVDAFLHSPMLPRSVAGKGYVGLFHISDWFPTIIDFTGIDFVPNDGFEFDGVSHFQAMSAPDMTYPRTDVLYNYYDNVDLYAFDIWKNGSFAIRNERYKLLHSFDSPTYGAWYSTAESMESVDDDLTAEIRCAPQIALGDGEFTYFLFDLVNDPYEMVNIYDSTDPLVVAAKKSLYELLPKYYDRSAEITYNMNGNPFAFNVWESHDNCIVPYTRENYAVSPKSFPIDCY